MMDPATVLRNKMISIAKQQVTIYYSDLAPLVSMHHQSQHFHQLLGDISKAERAEGRPLLSAIVVRKGDNWPGGGFFTLAKDLKLHNGNDDLAYWVQEIQRVHAYWSNLP